MIGAALIPDTLLTDVQDKTTARPALPGPEELLILIRNVLEDHKAEDLVVIDLANKSTIGDYMMIATGQSSRQVISMADQLIRRLKAAGLTGIKPEGIRLGDWVLIDAGDIIVHLFRPEVREFYGLQKMWEADFSDPDQNAENTG